MSMFSASNPSPITTTEPFRVYFSRTSAADIASIQWAVSKLQTLHSVPFHLQLHDAVSMRCHLTSATVTVTVTVSDQHSVR